MKCATAKTQNCHQADRLEGENVKNNCRPSERQEGESVKNKKKVKQLIVQICHVRNPNDALPLNAYRGRFLQEHALLPAEDDACSRDDYQSRCKNYTHNEENPWKSDSYSKEYVENRCQNVSRNVENIGKKDSCNEDDLENQFQFDGASKKDSRVPTNISPDREDSVVVFFMHLPENPFLDGQIIIIRPPWLVVWILFVFLERNIYLI